MRLTFRPESDAARSALQAIRRKANREAMANIATRVGIRTIRALVENTPKKWTGQTRKDWQMRREVDGNVIVTNRNKVMLFLEQGTRDHGPVRAAALYIPLKRHAMFGWRPGFKFGRDYVLRLRVRGIRPHYIVARQRRDTAKWLFADMKAYIRTLVR